MTMEQKAWNRITTFLDADNFNGFTTEDLFIKRFIPKAWGQDIASLSNMAEAIRLKHSSSRIALARAQQLMREVAARALHQSVSPYSRKIEMVNDLGRQGYYLEHLNIILGIAVRWASPYLRILT